jgi:DNA-binding response OmpR family regulator/signal transduction histidine kinase
MVASKDRILVVENDPLISDLIGRQALQPMGYQVQVISDASSAIPETQRFSPDLLIVDFNLPDLSGKDFLVALNSQGITTPVIVLAQKDMQGDIIQAFRLGAADYLTWPVKDAEIITVVERALKQVRERRERDRLAQRLQQTTQELQSRLRELTILFTVGKAVTSVTDQRILFDRIIQGAIKVTQSDLGWFLLHDEINKTYLLAAHHNLPASMAGRLNKPWDDGISSLVATSGEPLSIFGDPLKRFAISNLGRTALIVPIKAQKQVIGLLAVMRKIPAAFSQSDQNLLEAVSDYASISLVNARLFRALDERARTAQHNADLAELGEKIKFGLLSATRKELHRPIESALKSTRKIMENSPAELMPEQLKELETIKNNLNHACKTVEWLGAIQPGMQTRTGAFQLNEVGLHSARQFQPIALQRKLILSEKISPEPVSVLADASHVALVLDSLLTRAINLSPHGKQVTLRIDKMESGLPHIMVGDSSPDIDTEALTHLFDKGFKESNPPPDHFDGIGIELDLIKEIILAYDGQIWAENQPGGGVAIHITLPQPH